MEVRDPFVLLLLCVLDKGRLDGGVVLDESPVVPTFP